MIPSISIESPPLPDDFFNHILDEGKFREFIRQEYDYEVGRCGLSPRLSRAALHDVHQCYRHDIRRLDKKMKTSSPDHFKHAGFLAYWLRRHNPIRGWNSDSRDDVLAPVKKEERDFLLNYRHVYLAFWLGYKICLFYERETISEGQTLPVLNKSYTESVCYLMKYKSISPHAMWLIYRSLFFVSAADEEEMAGR